MKAEFGEEGKEKPFMPFYHLRSRAHCLCLYTVSQTVTHSNPTFLSVGTQNHFIRDVDTYRALSKPCDSVCHWIYLFVPLSKSSLYFHLCKAISGCKQQDWMLEWAQWVQDSLLQKHWSSSNAPYSLTRWSKGLTCSAYPGKHVLILPPAEVHILYVESHLESSERNAFYTENMFLTLKKYLSVTMQDRVLHKGLALWFIIFFYERRAWEL